MFENLIIKSSWFDFYIYEKSIKYPNSDSLHYYACYYFDANTGFAIELDDEDESLDEFIENNLNECFIVDNAIKPKIVGDKLIYFLKKK